MKYKKDDIVIRIGQNEMFGLYRIKSYDGTFFRMGTYISDWCLITSLIRNPKKPGFALHMLDSDIRKANLQDMWKHYCEHGEI